MATDKLRIESALKTAKDSAWGYRTSGNRHIGPPKPTMIVPRCHDREFLEEATFQITFSLRVGRAASVGIVSRRAASANNGVRDSVVGLDRDG